MEILHSGEPDFGRYTDCHNCHECHKDIEKGKPFTHIRIGGKDGSFKHEVVLCSDCMTKVIRLCQPRGYWVYDKNGMDWGIGAWVCSECRAKNDMLPTHILQGEGKPPITHERINPMLYAGSRFCPTCGVLMTGKAEE